LLPGVSKIGQKFLGGISIVPIILLGYLFNGLYYNFQAGIYIEEKTKYFPVVTGAGAAVNVLVNFLLIPVLGLIGAALATLASYVVMAGGLFYFSQKYYPIKYEYAKVFKILSLIIFCCCVYYYVLFNFGMTFPFKLVLLLFFALMLVLLRVLDKNEIVRIGKLLFRMK
jgi:O-antigen/teichoic acid export membrane protein